MGERLASEAHGQFSHYLTKRRWASLWHQLDEVLALKADSILEIGPGPGIFKATAQALGLRVETLDADSEFKPDYIGSAEDLPFQTSAYNLVCAFQVLEHLPYASSLKAFSEMSRVAGRWVVISLPDAQPVWPYSLYIPTRGDVKFLVPRPTRGPKEHVYKRGHFWEINKKGHSLQRVTEDFCEAADVALSKTYRVKENPYHRFFVFSVK